MRLFTTALVTLGFVTVAAPAMAANCYDMWYERNSIYNDNGYCFKTRLGKQTFDNSDCYTRSPSFSSWEQDRIDWLSRQERRKHCKVNN
jgi:hypothetical protein